MKLGNFEIGHGKMGNSLRIMGPQPAGLGDEIHDNILGREHLLMQILDNDQMLHSTQAIE